MGVLADACLGVPLYSKLEEKKNGLDVYQSVDNNRSIYKHYDNYKECYDTISFICPICKELVKEKEITAEFEKILEKGPERIKLLIKRYNELIINYEEIDIFDSLEKIYLEFEDLKKNYDENKYYFKHICRNKNKNCYIIFLKNQIM